MDLPSLELLPGFDRLQDRLESCQSTLFGDAGLDQQPFASSAQAVTSCITRSIVGSSGGQLDERLFRTPDFPTANDEENTGECLPHEGFSRAETPNVRTDSVYDFNDEDEVEAQCDTDADAGVELPKYGLRESARQRLALTSWIDKDESGDYDPVEERKNAYAQRRVISGPTARSHTRHGTANTRERRHATYKSREAARLNGAQLPFTVSLKSFTEDRLTKAGSLIADIPDNWPEDSYNHLDEGYFGDKDVAGSRVDTRGLPPGARWRSTQHGHDENGNYICGQDPLGEEHNLFRHEARYGCVPCRRARTACSLVADRYSWPCDACEQDGEDCQLILPPFRKASCEGCKQLKIKCSYREQIVQPSKCNECASQLGSQCIAGPAPGYKISCRYGDEDLAPMSREYSSCCACREQKIRCSLKKTTDLPPCQDCIENGIPCIFEPVFKYKKKAKANAAVKASNDDIDIEMNNAKDDMGMDSDVLETLDANPVALLDTEPSTLVPLKAPCCFDATINHGLPTFRIRTALCHPITFNCETSNTQFSDPFRDCSFCRDPNFAITGHDDFLTVKVQVNHGGLCYDEKSRHGHYARNMPPTRICCIHTMQRYQVIGCKHESIEPVDQHLAALMDECIDGPDAEPRPEDLCSLCLGAMSFRCTVPRYTDEFDYPLGEPAQGCGLQLCQCCHSILEDRFNGTVQELVRDMLEDHTGYPGIMRADLELLNASGLLPKNVEADLKLLMESAGVEGASSAFK